MRHARVLDESIVRIFWFVSVMKAKTTTPAQSYALRSFPLGSLMYHRSSRHDLSLMYERSHSLNVVRRDSPSNHCVTRKMLRTMFVISFRLVCLKCLHIVLESWHRVCMRRTWLNVCGLYGMTLLNLKRRMLQSLFQHVQRNDVEPGLFLGTRGCLEALIQCVID